MPMLKTVCRIVEILFCLISLVIAFPIIIGFCVIVIFLSGRSPLIAHLRVGKYGTSLWVYKIRTMWTYKISYLRYSPFVEYIDNSSKEECILSNKFAVFLRRSSLDELPQLAQVILGNMSIVGPRPITQEEIDLYYGDYKTKLLSITPGITGLWQIHKSRKYLTYRQRKKYDLFYIKCSGKKRITLNIYILLMTVKSMSCLYGR